MHSVAELIGPIYQKLLGFCEKHRLSLGLDLENPAQKIIDEKAAKFFLESELRRACKNCQSGGHIIIAQSKLEKNTDDLRLKLSVKHSGKPLDAKTKAALTGSGLEVRSRFGYDNIVSLKLR